MFIGTDMDDCRVNLVACIVGGRGRGKTTYTHKVVDEYKKNNPRKKILIVDTFLSPAWDGVPQITVELLPRWLAGEKRLLIDIDNPAETISNILKYCPNTVVIFEDAIRYTKSNLAQCFKRVPTDTKQLNIDCYFVYHSLMGVPLDIIRLTNFVVLFKTLETFSSDVRRKFPFPEVCKAFDKVAEVTAKAKSDKDPKYFYNEVVRLD